MKNFEVPAENRDFYFIHKNSPNGSVYMNLFSWPENFYLL